MLSGGLDLASLAVIIFCRCSISLGVESCLNVNFRQSSTDSSDKSNCSIWIPPVTPLRALIGNWLSKDRSDLSRCCRASIGSSGGAKFFRDRLRLVSSGVMFRMLSVRGSKNFFLLSGYSVFFVSFSFWICFVCLIYELASSISFCFSFSLFSSSSASWYSSLVSSSSSSS